MSCMKCFASGRSRQPSDKREIINTLCPAQRIGAVMDGRNWKWDMDLETDFSGVEPAEYTVDEILSQFREEYGERQPDPQTAEPSDSLYAREDLSDHAIPDDEFFLDIPEEEPVPENREAPETLRPEVDDMQNTRNKKSVREKTTQSLRSWRNRLSDSFGRHSRSRRAEREAFDEFDNTEAEPDDVSYDESLWVESEGTDTAPATSDREETGREKPDFWKTLIQEVKTQDETAEPDAPEQTDWEEAEAAFPEYLEQKPVPEQNEEPETAAEEAVVPDEEPEENTGRESDEVISGQRASRPGRRGKVWEEFPDTQEQETEPFTDTLDYSVLFKMFADTPEKREETESAGSFPAAETSPEEKSRVPGRSSGKAADDTTAEARDRAESVPEKEPLFAETSMDFRDILREFMLGDQHPFYADMPGIGQKAQVPAEEERIPEREPADKRIKDLQPERKDSYSVWEDFPADFTDTMFTSRKSGTAESQSPAEEPAQPADSPEEHIRAEAARVPEAPAETETGSLTQKSDPTPSDNAEVTAEPQEKGLRRLMRGLGEKAAAIRNAGAGKKTAINEPHAFVGYEDYLPAEGQEKESGITENISEANAGTTPNNGTNETEPPESTGEKTDLTGEFPEEEEILYEGDFPSFGQWILNELMNIWIRLNGIGDRESTATMEDASEDLGKEVNVANASRYYGSQVTMLRMRFQIGLALLAVLAYLSLGFPVSGMLKTAKVSAAMCLGLQLTIMLLCLDIVTNAAINLVRRKFGADGLAVLFCVITSFDALVVAVGGFGNPHIPLCLFSSLALMGILFSSLLSARALRKAIRVPAIGKRVYCVTAEEGVRGGRELTLLKSVRPVTGFVRRSEEAPPDEMLFSRFAVLELAVAVVLSFFTGLVKHGLGDYLYILSAVLSCAVPVTALLAFALPFYIGSQRIFSSGAAIAGWSGMHDIGCSRNLIVTDRDLFPEDTVSIETVRIFADDSAERVIGYAGSMIAASGSGLAPSFADLMERNNCRMRKVEEFRWLSGGGLQGIIEGHLVLCGNSDLMQLMNVKIPYRLVDRTTVLLAIDGVLYGIFKIQYTGLPEIRTALQELIASNRHPIFAIRDFNITPDLLHEVFDVATDGYDFPPFGDRFRISEAQPSETSKISAVVCREGLGPLTHLADTGRSMYVAVRLNLILTAAAAVIGILLVFFRLIGTGTVSAWLPFVIMLLDALAVSLISLFMRF